MRRTGGEQREEKGRGGPSLQNEDPKPQDGWKIILTKCPTKCSYEYRRAWEMKEWIPVEPTRIAVWIPVELPMGHVSV